MRTNEARAFVRALIEKGYLELGDVPLKEQLILSSLYLSQREGSRFSQHRAWIESLLLIMERGEGESYDIHAIHLRGAQLMGPLKSKLEKIFEEELHVQNK